MVGNKFTVFALFYFVFEGNFPRTSPRGAYIWRSDLTEGFFRYRFGGLSLVGLIFGILRYLVVVLKVAEQSFGSLYVICQILARERLQLTS